MDGNKLIIHVQIGNISLPMTVNSTEEEAVVRKAASNVNQQLISVRDRYKAVPNEQYYTAMVMLNSEIKALTAEGKNDTKPIFDILSELEQEIDDLIHK